MPAFGAESLRLRSRSAMNTRWKLWTCAAAMSGLAGCGQAIPDRKTAQSDAGVTIELPEPSTPVADPAVNVAAEAKVAALTNAAGFGPAVPADVAPEKPPSKPPKPAPEPELPKRAVRETASERTQAAEAPDTSTPLPLPNAVIVRTIEKIGFPCGSIVSSSRMDGSSDYRINCSSGASYRASNRTGRYRFSKAGGD